MLTSGMTCTLTPSCLAVPPCTPVSPIVCKRKSPPSLPPPSRSRLSLPLRGNTPSGSVAPSSLPCPPSNRCESPSKNTTSPALESSTGSASKLLNITGTKTPKRSKILLLIFVNVFLKSLKIHFILQIYSQLSLNVSLIKRNNIVNHQIQTLTMQKKEDHIPSHK